MQNNQILLLFECISINNLISQGHKGHFSALSTFNTLLTLSRLYYMLLTFVMKYYINTIVWK